MEAVTAAYSAFAKVGRRVDPAPSPAPTIPRVVVLLALLIALVMGGLALTATGTGAQVPEGIPPAGSVTVVVLQSDGLALLPVGVAVIPPIACLP